MKKGFGLLEVLVAAVVLGFLIVGLNKLQSGNREAILRIRARDAANIIAQHVLDSLGIVGISDNISSGDTIIKNKQRDYAFESKTGEVPMKFNVLVEYLPPPSTGSGNSINIETDVNAKSNLVSSASSKKIAKNIQATVSWDFKKTTQSIKMSKVVR